MVVTGTGTPGSASYKILNAMAASESTTAGDSETYSETYTATAGTSFALANNNAANVLSSLRFTSVDPSTVTLFDENSLPAPDWAALGFEITVSVVEGITIPIGTGGITGATPSICAGRERSRFSRPSQSSTRDPSR